MQTNVHRKFHTKEQKFGNVKIAHFGLFLPLSGTQKNVKLEINKNEVERARLVKEASFPVVLKYGKIEPHLLKLC